MVRDSEATIDEPVLIVADLPQEQDAAERSAEEVMGTVMMQLGAGRAVILDTAEHGGRVVSSVVDRRAAGRRLARAISTEHRSAS
jgi:hypothetical protein